MKYSGATILSPNKSELAQATGIAASCIEQLISEGQRLCEKLQVDHVVFTRSEEGISLLSSTEHDQFSATAREVVDVCGAGDAVISALAVGLAQGMSTKEAVWLGNAAGGLAVQKFGTAAIPLSELEAECARLLNNDDQLGKVKSLDSLQPILSGWRSRREKIVFTNGCFDLFHVGHLKLLEACKAQGTKLIVGVNSDASVSRLKGPQRPVVPHEQRVQVLAGLEVVDAVVVFEEDTPLGLIEAIKPDILAKGGDYTVETVVGAPFVHSYGGEVKLIPLVDGISTSALVNRITQRHTGATM
ncbi:D-glycero-beta-D-manno-heptose 1-phosphate adenylyltransferase [bacterium]|nr:D-glycero-beta-D-manno-heptose 1-phosphate adenylyltransferase [bacterium]